MSLATWNLECFQHSSGFSRTANKPAPLTRPHLSAAHQHPLSLQSKHSGAILDPLPSLVPYARSISTSTLVGSTAGAHCNLPIAFMSSARPRLPSHIISHQHDLCLYLPPNNPFFIQQAEQSKNLPSCHFLLKLNGFPMHQEKIQPFFQCVVATICTVHNRALLKIKSTDQTEPQLTRRTRTLSWANW